MSGAINSNGATPDGCSGSLVHCGVDQLRPHPAYASLDIAVSAADCRRSSSAETWPFKSLCSSRARTIVDGYDRWELARQQGRPTLTCVEYDFSEQDALVWLLQKLRPYRGVNNFRILLALKVKNTRARAICETSLTPAEFMALIAEHVPDRYRHSMREMPARYNQ